MSRVPLAELHYMLTTTRRPSDGYTLFEEVYLEPPSQQFALLIVT